MYAKVNKRFSHAGQRFYAGDIAEGDSAKFGIDGGNATEVSADYVEKMEQEEAARRKAPETAEKADEGAAKNKAEKGAPKNKSAK